MTENQLKKLDGKYIRIEKHAFMHSVLITAYEGKVEVIRDDVFLIRDGITKCYEHYGFYLIPKEGLAHMFKYSDLKLISSYEVLQ